jgi:iron complex transport system permease protein
VRKYKSAKWIWLLFTGAILAALLSIMFGSVTIPIQDILSIFKGRVDSGFTLPEAQGKFASILFDLRVPRTILVLLVGAALATSGGAYQGLFQNPLADPYLIGVASGAGLGSIVAMTIQWPQDLLGYFAVPISAFGGSILAVLLVYSLSKIGKTIHNTTLILAGVAVSSLSNALTSFLLINAGGELRRAIVWMMGGSTLVGWKPVIASTPFILLGIGLLCSMGYQLNVLQFGDEEARQMGVTVKKVRILIILAASLTTAAAVAFSGTIAFVGLVVPHILRRLTGNDYRLLLPLSALGGAIFLSISDILARILLSPQEIPVGVITILFGAPFFLFILRKTKRKIW